MTSLLFFIPNSIEAKKKLRLKCPSLPVLIKTYIYAYNFCHIIIELKWNSFCLLFMRDS
jgi:hypothetical protein